MPQLNAESADQDALNIIQITFVENCVTVGSAIMRLYEYLITTDQEVELVWKHRARFSLPSVLLVSTRVCMVATAILQIVPTPSTCTGYSMFIIFEQIMDLAGFIQVALFSALRVSALYNRNIALFLAVFLLSLTPVGTNIFKQISTTYIQEPGVCFQDSRLSDNLVQKFILITRIPLIVADSLVLILIWAKTYKQILLSCNSGVSTPLSTCLARDGGFYFLALFGINVIQIVTFRTHLGAPVDIMITTLPPVLINRFMLNLRQVGSTPDQSDSVSPDREVISTPRFQLSEQVVGSMGEPLEYGGSTVPGDGEHDTHENTEVDGHCSQSEEGRESQGRSADTGESAAASA